MNGGAYGREVADILVDCDVVLPEGELVTLPVKELDYSYRHSRAARRARSSSRRASSGRPGDPEEIGAEMDRIAAAREETQPLRSQDRRLDLQEPAGDKAWRLVDAAGCRGLRLGGAQVSEKHANFLINTGRRDERRHRRPGRGSAPRVSASQGVSSGMGNRAGGRWW